MKVEPVEVPFIILTIWGGGLSTVDLEVAVIERFKGRQLGTVAEELF